MQSEKFLSFFGYLFLIWWIFDIFLMVYIYGLRELSFLWFCSVSLVILALGMILRNAMLLNSFLSIAILVQPFWIADYLWIAFFDKPINGFVMYAFQPGYIPIQFIDGFRHLLMIPFGFYAVFTLSKKTKQSYYFIPAYLSVLLVMSRFFPPGYTNINCASDSCIYLAGGWLSGIQYFLFFLFLTIVLSLMINFVINFLLERISRIRNKRIYKTVIFYVFIFLLVLAFTVILSASIKYSKVPKYFCSEAEDCENCTVDLECRYVYSENLTLFYALENYGNKDYACDVLLKTTLSETYKLIENESIIYSGVKRTTGYYLGYPEEDSRIHMKASCRKLN